MVPGKRPSFLAGCRRKSVHPQRSACAAIEHGTCITALGIAMSNANQSLLDASHCVPEIVHDTFIHCWRPWVQAIFSL
jgi:hypothetical protein